MSPTTNVMAPPPGHVFNQLTFLSRVKKDMTRKLAASYGSTVLALIVGGYSKVFAGDEYCLCWRSGDYHSFSRPTKALGRAKLYWGARNINLVDHLRKSGLLDGIDVAEISVDKRLDVQSILDVGIDGRLKHPMVITSGPRRWQTM